MSECWPFAETRRRQGQKARGARSCGNARRGKSQLSFLRASVQGDKGKVHRAALLTRQLAGSRGLRDPARVGAQSSSAPPAELSFPSFFIFPPLYFFHSLNFFFIFFSLTFIFFLLRQETASLLNNTLRGYL